MLANHDQETETVTERELRERLEQERKEKACHQIFKKRDYSPERLVEDLLDKHYPQQRYFDSIGRDPIEVEEIGWEDFWDGAGDLDKKWQLEQIQKKESGDVEKEEETGRKLPAKDERDDIPMELKEAVKNLKNDGFNFKDEINQTNLKYDWADKYRPRKPKYRKLKKMLANLGVLLR